MSQSPQSHLLFHASIEVSAFSSKKNRKVIHRNFQTGRNFIGSDPKHAKLDRILVCALQSIARNLHFNKPINFAVRAVFLFHSPNWLTKKGSINKRAGDLSNLIQGPEDSLMAAQIIEDDSQILSYDGSRKILSQDTKIEIYLFKIDMREYLSVNTGD